MVEPNWAERLTVTVGPDKADIVGIGQPAIQAAVDYLAGLGGGTVKLLPSVYRLRNAVTLRSGIRLVGTGDDTILCKEPSVATTLQADSDWFDQEITLTDAAGFQLGDGVCLRTKNPHNGGTDVYKGILVARDGNRFKLDHALRQNFWQLGETTVSTLFPLLNGDHITDLAIEHLALDGNRVQNEKLDGNYAGCVFLQDCSRIQMRRVTARNFNGDGISWQICHDVLVEDCHCHDNVDLGLHPGSGSQRPIIRNNRLQQNGLGIFFCWGVKYGLAEGNLIEDCQTAGISIGHRDTENLITHNTIRRSGQVGILFRPERGPAFAPHRNRIEANRVEDSGPDDGIAVDVQGQTESIVLRGNEFVETRGPAARIAIRLGAETKEIELPRTVFRGSPRKSAICALPQEIGDRELASGKRQHCPLSPVPNPCSGYCPRIGSAERFRLQGNRRRRAGGHALGSHLAESLFQCAAEGDSDLNVKAASDEG